ncbi:MAG: hypothetical protein ACYDH9_27525 [Limisphaerales bacterium]
MKTYRTGRDAQEEKTTVEEVEQLLTRAQVAKLLCVCDKTVERHDDVLHPLRFNRRLLRYRRSDVRRFLAEAAGEGQTK